MCGRYALEAPVLRLREAFDAEPEDFATASNKPANKKTHRAGWVLLLAMCLPRIYSIERRFGKYLILWGDIPVSNR